MISVQCTCANNKKPHTTEKSKYLQIHQTVPSISHGWVLNLSSETNNKPLVHRKCILNLDKVKGGPESGPRHNTNKHLSQILLPPTPVSFSHSWFYFHNSQCIICLSYL